ncbi:MAG: hypothetical protein M9888_02750 [Chitinophagales bacterium]|nr:hypothetical protein [Chitinophagales bacterium]
MKSIFTLFLISISILSSHVYSQTVKSFPEETNEFINSFTTYLASNNRPESKEIATWLKVNMLTKIPTEQLSQLQPIANLMLQKKIPLWPGFYKYAVFIQTIGTNTDISTEIVHKNNTILLQLLQANTAESPKQFIQYIEYLTEHYKTKALYSDKLKAWYTNQPYKIAIESGLPVYLFEKINLLGTTSYDSLLISDTKGKFYPFENLWEGNAGKTTFRRVGFSDSDVYAEFKSHYKIDLSKPELTIDTVTFNFKPYIKGAIQGKFEDKLFATKGTANNFPKFSSFEKVPFNLSENIQFESGISIEGNKIFVTSTGRSEPARFTLFNDKKQKILEAEGNRYLITDFKQIDASKVKVNFAFLDSTTIFHPASIINYNIEKKNLKITRDNNNEARIPFIAPFFKMNLYVDQIDWNIDSNYADINATAANAKLPTYFESFDYYSPGSDAKYQQLLSIDPIGSLAAYCESVGYNRLSIDEIARVWNAGGYKAIEQLTYKMMEDGYLYYDRETGMVDVYNKLFLHARIRKEKDVNYDNIKLTSITQGKVARLQLDSKKLQIYGTETTKITSAINIIMNPSSDTIYVSKNRGIIFKGRLSAGKFNFYSDSIEFNYDDYIFNLKNIDSMLIMVPLEQTDTKGNPYYTEINTPIENISGKIYIADPNNRNASTKYTIYPKFDNTDTSVVTFNKSKFGDKYNPDNFSFKIYPFTLENLNTIQTDSLRLKGQLQSANIFQNLETDLTITKDRTLGLDFSTDSNGLDLFDGKGIAQGRIKLDQDGLRLQGNISKENINFYSEEFQIFPDSLYSTLDKWEGIPKENAPFPVFNASGAKLTWTPSHDSLNIIPIEKSDIPIFDQQATVNATFQIIQHQLLANGTLALGEVSIQSDSIDLKNKSAFIPHSPLKIIDDTYKAWSTPLADMAFDFEKSTAQIIVAEDSLSRYNMNYIKTNNHHDILWDFKNKIVSIHSDTSKNSFYEFDGNKFNGIKLSAQSSTFNTHTRELKLKGISQILVADSKVIPYQSELTISDGGLIDMMDNAVVVFNTDSSFHTIYNASVEILDKNLMKGSGKVLIGNGDNKGEFIVENFKTIEQVEEAKKKQDVKSTFYTIANGTILEENHFKISDNLNYKGNFNFTSLNKNIELNGYSKPIFKSISETDWFKISQNSDITQSSLEIDSLKNELNQQLYVGLAMDLNEMIIYPRIIQAKQSSTDKLIYTAQGSMISSDKDSSIIYFGQQDAIKKANLFTPLLTYNDENASLKAVGKFDIANNLEPVLFNLFGEASYLPNDTNYFSIQGNAAIDMYLTPEIEALLRKFMTDFHFNGTFLNLNKNKALSQAITRLITDPNTANLVEQDMQNSNILNIPQNFPYNMVFSDVNFIFDPIEGTFKNITPLSMLVFAGKPYTQKIKAFIEVGPRNTNDFINIYLTTQSEDWIFLRYTAGELGIVSSDAALNSKLSSIKEDKRSLKSGKEIIYKITSINPALKDNFVIRMEDFKDQNIKN